MVQFNTTRKCDKLGRFPIPAKITRHFNILGKNNKLEIFIEGDNIILQKWTNMKCIFCRAKKDLIKFKGKFICSSCKIQLLSNQQQALF